MPTKTMNPLVSQTKAKNDVFVDHLYSLVSPPMSPLDSSYKANDLTLFAQSSTKTQPAPITKVQAPRFTRLPPAMQSDSDSPSSSSASSDPKYREMKMKYLRALNVPGLPVTKGSFRAERSPPLCTSSSSSPALSPSKPLCTEGPPCPSPSEGCNDEALRPPSRESTPSPLPASPRTPSLLAQQLRALRSGSVSPSPEPASPESDDGDRSGASTRVDESRSSPIPIPRGANARRLTAPGPFGDRRRRNGRVAMDSVIDSVAATTLATSVFSPGRAASLGINAFTSGSVSFSFGDVFASRPTSSFALYGPPIFDNEASEVVDVAFAVEF